LLVQDFLLNSLELFLQLQTIQGRIKKPAHNSTFENMAGLVVNEAF
jgi:hypothetical protein